MGHSAAGTIVIVIGLDVAAIEVETDRYFAQFERLTDRYFETIAMLLMPLDRRQQHTARMP